MSKADNREKKIACQIINAMFVFTYAQRFSLGIYFNIEMGYFNGMNSLNHLLSALVSNYS